MSSAVIAVAEHARDRPEEPWLFFRDAWNWRWTSWGEVRDWSCGWVERIDALDAGRRVGFKYLPRPECIVLDLAIQESGRVAVPVDGRFTAEDCSRICAERRCDLWVEACRSTSQGARLARSLEFRRSDVPRETVASGADEAVIVVGGGRPRGVSAAELLTWVEALSARLPAACGREILVSTTALDDPLERLLVAWAAMADVALILEPDRQALLATAIWARPTVFAGTGAEIEGLRRYLEKVGSSLLRGFRFPGHFRRLHTVIRRGSSLVNREQEACWRQWQVAVLRQEELLGVT